MNKKRILTLCLCLVLLFSLTACEKKGPSDPGAVLPTNTAPNGNETDPSDENFEGAPDHLDPGSMEIIDKDMAWRYALDIICENALGEDPLCPWNNGVKLAHTDMLHAYNGRQAIYVFSLTDLEGNPAGEIRVDGRNLNPKVVSFTFRDWIFRNALSASEKYNEEHGANLDLSKRYDDGAGGIIVAKSGETAGDWEYFEMRSQQKIAANVETMKESLKYADVWKGDLPDIPVEETLQEKTDKYGTPGETITKEQIQNWGVG